MNTQISDKLVRFGRVLDIVGKVLAALCIFVAVLALICAVVVALLPEDLAMRILNAIPLTSDALALPASASLGDFINTTAVFGFKVIVIFPALTLVIYCLLSAVILFILSALFKATAVNKTPFLPANIKRLKIIGVILIVASFALGLGNLIAAFCVLALAYVFQYGAELQQQADETL